MSSLTELSTAELRDAGDAVETLIEFRDYLPLGGMLLMLAGRFRDAVRKELGVPSVPRVTRGPELKRLQQLKDDDLDALAYAVGDLVTRLRRVIEDAELGRLLDEVNAELLLLMVDRDKAAEAARAAEEAKAS
jgi:hypothetical protein